MSKKIVLGLVLLSALAACQPKEPEPMVTDPVMVSPEPVFQGKYGRT